MSSLVWLMTTMSSTFIQFLFAYISFVSTLDQNYQEILLNLHNLPDFAQKLQMSQTDFQTVANILDESTDLSRLLKLTVFAENETTTISPAVPITPVVSALCLNQTIEIIRAVLQRQAWAVKMLDTAGKPPPDFFDGDITWLGDYEVCLAIQSNLSSSSQQFNGEYCLVGISLPGVFNPLTGQGPVLRIGLCVPDSCSEADAVLLFNSLLSQIPNTTMLATSASCHEPAERELDTRATIVIVILSIFAAIIAVATVYDVLWIQWPKRQIDNLSAILNGEVTENYQYKISEEEERPLLGGKVESEYKPGSYCKVLLSFSVYTNGAKILNTNQPAGSLSAVNGIRFLSMSWVILGHTYVFNIGIIDNLLVFMSKMFKRWTFGAILNALVSVDTFFALSGLLLTYLIMKELSRRQGKMKWFMFYFHRFWRLTPPYMLILMTYVSLFSYMGSGPLWSKNGPEKNYCKDSWWYNLLYINNFVSIADQDHICMGWVWYLANDMQFFIISPLIIIPLFYSKIAGTILMMVFMLGSWIATGIISSHYELPPSLLVGNEVTTYFDKYYIKPWCRIGPYLVGMFTGYVLYKTDCRCRINKYINLLMWAIAAGLAIVILYGLHDEVNGNPMSVNVAALYNTVHRTLWGACVCWVIFACATGNGGFVNTILSWKLFVPLSRLTYCAYLVHPMVISYFASSQQRLIHLTDMEVIYLFIPNLVLSYAVAFVTSLAFESPMMGLEKAIFKRGEKKD